MKKILIIFILWIGWVSSAMAAWHGPFEVINLGWGEQVGQVAIEHSDMGDLFVTIIRVDKNGNILIPDGGNQRLLIYSSTGSLIKVIKPSKYLPYIVDDKILFKAKGKYMVYDYFGDLINQFNGIIYGNIYIVDDKIIAYACKEKKYYAYSCSGQLLETYSEKPLELGVVKGRSLGGKRYRTTIKYPDMTYTLNKGLYRKYIRLCKENIYAVSGKSAEIFNTSGEAIDKIIMPQDQINVISPGGRGMEAVSEIIEQYGEPVVAPNGDVFTWKRTKDTYSIIKWIWIESRDAPVNLKASVSDGKISLSWETPKQDVNSVKAYEIYRSPDVCGPFNKIDKAKKGVLQYADKKVKTGETYYYQICAERGSGYSGYSNKAVGSIKD